MRIGFDFDNTIVSYDRLFHKVAVELGVIPEEIPVSKLAVRDYLRAANSENVWTEMQGYVYGVRMSEAEAYPGVQNVMVQLLAQKHELIIVSHKTRYPFLGPQYDLHSAARSWITEHLHHSGQMLIAESNIYFELSKTDKIDRIAKLACDAFIDDLPEILLDAKFPSRTIRLLFDPECHHTGKTETQPLTHCMVSWLDLPAFIMQD